MSRTEHGVAHSIRQRVQNHSRRTGEDYNVTLIRYVVERLLHRLQITPSSRQRFGPRSIAGRRRGQTTTVGGFLRRSGLPESDALADVIRVLHDRLAPLLIAASK